jgi:hypothetical protein
MTRIFNATNFHQGTVARTAFNDLHHPLGGFLGALGIKSGTEKHKLEQLHFVFVFPLPVLVALIP